MEYVLIAVSIPVLTIGILFTCIAGYARVRRKGFEPPASALLLLSLGLLAVSSCLPFLPKVVFSEHGGLIFAVIFWIPAIAFAGALAVMVRVLPRRNSRVSGPRRPRFPFAAAGFLLFGAGAAGVVWAIWQEAFLTDSTQLFVILAGFGCALIALGKRAKSSPSIEEATRADPRAPVLYLRPFMQEMVPFVTGKKSTHGRYLSTAQRAISSGDEETDFAVAVRFEQYFRETLEARVGPFVALGNPEDYLPPEGAARTYSSDSEWKARVERLVAACCCMVAEAGISSNLEWELRYLLQGGLQEKLFILTPPSPPRTHWLNRLFFWARMMHFVPWDDFTKTMTACGYEIAGDPGPGSVLCFDAAGKSVTVKTGATQPEEYVASIREFLEMSGGYAPASFDRPLAAGPELPPVATGDAPETAIQSRSMWSRLLSSAAQWGIFALLIAAVSFGPRLVKQLHEESRTRTLKTFASQIGFQFSDGDVTISDPDVAETSLIDHASSDGQAMNGMEGERDGFRVLLFDFRHTIHSDDRGGSDESRQIFQTVAAFCGAGQQMPSFQLQEYSLGNALAIVDREERVEMDASPEFTKRFILQSKDKAGSMRMFSPELRSFLIEAYPRGNWHIEGSGRCLLLYKPGVRIEAENWAGFLDDSSHTARDFFQHAGSDRKPQIVEPK